MHCDLNLSVNLWTGIGLNVHLCFFCISILKPRGVHIVYAVRVLVSLVKNIYSSFTSRAVFCVMRTLLS